MIDDTRHLFLKITLWYHMKTVWYRTKKVWNHTPESCGSLSSFLPKTALPCLRTTSDRKGEMRCRKQRIQA
jgi:hypothetical protein